MAIAVKDNRRFEMECEPIDVTSISRPDTSWTMIDAAGHPHSWWTDGAPAFGYDPSKSYNVPTLRYVVDDRWIDEWGDERESGHHECVQCGERVVPRTTADMHRQYIPGPRRCYIDGERVTREVFEREAKAAGLLP